jgi:hypothetical protein
MMKMRRMISMRKHVKNSRKTEEPTVTNQCPHCGAQTPQPTATRDIVIDILGCLLLLAVLVPLAYFGSCWLNQQLQAHASQFLWHGPLEYWDLH